MPGFILTFCLMLAYALPASTRAEPIAELYTSMAIVTGTGETNRQPGLRDCLDRVLVRVSGDQRLPLKPETAALRDLAGSFVREFRYRDRLEGVPIHDEQGTYDRPHDLTCIFDRAKVDAILTSLGSRPWLDKRPVLTVFLSVEQNGRRFALSADGGDSTFMGESFANAAEPLAMRILLPAKTTLAAAKLDELSLRQADTALLDKIAKQAGGDQALAGSIVWSDEDFGWVADWRIAFDGATRNWRSSGVSFDEAFRVAMRGAAQILSGNGQP